MRVREYRRDRFAKMLGMSLLEVMISLVLVVILASIMLFTTRGGDIDKRRLESTGKLLIDALRKAQSEAHSQRAYRGVCFKQDSGNGFGYVQIYAPQLTSAGVPSDLDCGAGDALGRRYDFKENVQICNGTCDTNVALSKSIFFNKNGAATIQNGTRTSFQICVINSKLNAGKRAREIEVMSIGMIKFLKEGQTGSLSTVIANSGNCV